MHNPLSNTWIRSRFLRRFTDPGSSHVLQFHQRILGVAKNALQPHIPKKTHTRQGHVCFAHTASAERGPASDALKLRCALPPGMQPAPSQLDGDLNSIIVTRSTSCDGER